MPEEQQPQVEGQRSDRELRVSGGSRRGGRTRGSARLRQAVALLEGAEQVVELLHGFDQRRRQHGVVALLGYRARRLFG